jgi:hypothetical protein
MYIQRIYIGHTAAIWRDLTVSINCTARFIHAPGGDQVGTSLFTDYAAELDSRIL